MSLWFAMLGCGEPSVAPQPVEVPAPAEAKPEGDAPDAAKTEAGDPAEKPVRMAKVLEVLPGGDRYTYARMDACGQEAWVAGPSSSFEVGQTLEMVGGVTMTDFKSETLGRDFDVLLMVDTWTQTDKPVDCSAMPKPVSGDLAGGRAAEVLEGGGYTYVRLEHCGESHWYAGPETPVKVGDNVVVERYMVREKFPAKSLDRTFDELRLAHKYLKANALPACE